MSLTNIISKILDDANKKAAEIKKEASNTISSIIKDADVQAQNLFWEIIRQTKQKVALENKRFEVNQAIEYKKAILTTKQELIDEVFKKAQSRLSNLSDEDYISLVKAMLLNSVEKGDEVIVISKQDKRRIDDRFINTINHELEKRGKAGKLKIRVEDNLKDNTFILETENTRLDISFDSVLAALRDELLGEVARILFRENTD